MTRSYLILFFILSVLLFSGCGDKTTDPNENLPVLRTKEITQLEVAFPTVTITMISPGASDVTTRAICWGTAPHPDLSGEHRSLGVTNAEYPYDFGMTFDDLIPGATYYVRGYAKNSHGEAWSNDVSFTMLPMLWDKTELGNETVLNNVHFLNENIGWICGSNGMIKKSLDGGATWTDVSSGTNANLDDMQWIDENNAWIVGNYPNVLLKTTNAGATWQEINLDFDSERYLISVHFENILIGYLLTGWGDVFKTIDGGSSWTQIRNGGTGSYVFFNILSHNDTIIIAGNGITISDNGGVSWRTQLVMEHEYHQILFREPSTLWIAGGSGLFGVLYKSEDLGATWANVNTGLNSPINSICAAPGTTSLWVAGNNGSIYESTDDGMTWRVNYTHLNTITFNSVYAISETKAWIVGQYGTLLKKKER